MRRGLEKALDQIEAERGQSAEAAIHAQRSAKGLPRSDSIEKERDVRRVVMRERRQAAWRHLTLPERDVLTVLSAICKVQSSSRCNPQWAPMAVRTTMHNSAVRTSMHNSTFVGISA